DLDLEMPLRGVRPGDFLIGVSVEHCRVVDGAPLVVRRCRFRGGQIAVQLADDKGDSAGAVVRENDFHDVFRAVLLMGSWQRVAVVGNIFRGSLCGFQLEMLGARSGDLLLDNNTFVDGTYAIRLVDSDVKGRLVCRNNLMLN